MANEFTQYLTGVLNGSIIPVDDDRQVHDTPDGDPAEEFGRLLAHHMGWASAEAEDNFESGGTAPTRPGYDPSQGLGSDATVGDRDRFLRDVHPGYAERRNQEDFAEMLQGNLRYHRVNAPMRISMDHSIEFGPHVSAPLTFDR